MKHAAFIAALLASLGLSPMAKADRLHTASPFLRDTRGRVVFVHGVNAVDPASKQFTLAYRADHAIAAPTETFVPVARHYGGHYFVSIEGPATVTSPADAPLLIIHNTGSGPVNVSVTKNP